MPYDSSLLYATIFLIYKMIQYFTLWTYLSLCSAIDIANIKQKQKDILVLLSIIFVSLFCGLRGDVDNDYMNYVGYWDSAPSLQDESLLAFFWDTFSHPVEFGFMLSCAILKSIGLGYQSIFILCSLLTFILFYKSAKLLTPTPNIALFIFMSQFIMMPFMQIRYGVAMTCILYSIANWHQGYPKKSIIYILIGGLFHRLTWGCLLIMPLLKIPLKYIIYLSIISIIIPPSLISNLFSLMISFTGLNIYQVYLQGEVESLSLFSLALYLILVLPFLIFFKKKFKADSKNTLFLKMYLLYLIIFFLTRDFEILVRIAGVFSLSICFILPLYISLFKKSSINLLFYYLILTIYCFLKYYPCLKFFDEYKLNLFS